MTPRRLQHHSAAARRAAGPASLLLGLIAWLIAAPTVAAHVEIDVGDGQYVMEIGFRDEPAYLGQPNALYVRVEAYATGGTEPVNDLAGALQGEVSKNGQTMSLSLIPTGDGEYEGPFVPTETGDYTFRVFGMIGDAQVDESVTSGPNTFNSVEPLSAIEFPAPRPDVATVQADAAAAAAAANTARTLAIAGLVVGGIGLVLGAMAFARSRRAHPADSPPATPAAGAGEPSGKLIR